MMIVLKALLVYCLFVAVIVHADQIQLDHVIIAVNNLDEANETYQSLGFTIKSGKLHKNGLLNSHIKFSNRTELELMSIAGVTLDDVARKYDDFLKSGEGGAYIAFSGISIIKASEKLKLLDIKHQIKNGRLWDYITFYDEPGFEHIFFINTRHTNSENAATWKHMNGSIYINGIWFEASAKVGRFLEEFGALPCGKMSNKSIPAGDIYQVGKTALIAVAPRSITKRPRILGLSFQADRLKPTNDAHGIWVKPYADTICTTSAFNNQMPSTP